MANAVQMTRYVWRENTRQPVPAQTAGDELARLAAENNGELRPHVVAESQRPEDAPLHPCFEWDDPRAATLYRDDQARQIIRSVRVMTAGAEGPDVPPQTRVQYVAVRLPESGGRAYVEVSRALSDADLRRQVLDDAEAQLRGLRRRFDHLTELSDVFRAIDRIEDPAA